MGPTVSIVPLVMPYSYDRTATSLNDGFVLTANSAGEATFKKLRDGTWGLLVNNGSVKPGDSVLTVTKTGKRETKIVGKIIWSGNGVSITTIGVPMEAPRPPQSNPVTSRPRGKYECEECGDFVAPGSECWETGARH